MTAPKTRLMIVDNDASMSRFLSSYLSRQAFEITVASSGEEAIRMFRACDPALVLLDMAMGGMSGLDTLERLKQIKPDVSVIIVSGQNSPDLIFKPRSSARKITSTSPSSLRIWKRASPGFLISSAR